MKLEEEKSVKKPSPKTRFDDPEICPTCKGQGTVPGDLLEEPCETCGGEGIVWKY